MKVLFINNPVIRQNDLGLFAAAGPVMPPDGLLSLAGSLLHHRLAEVRWWIRCPGLVPAEYY